MRISKNTIGSICFLLVLLLTASAAFAQPSSRDESVSSLTLRLADAVEVPLITPMNEETVRSVLDEGAPPSLAIRHSVPELPLVIDGVYYEPEEIRLFHGQPLHFYVSGDTWEEGVIHAFTSKASLADHIQQEKGLSAEKFLKSRVRAASANAEKASNTAYFYEHNSWSGSVLPVECGYQANLGGTWWNDRISSTLGQSGVDFVILYEHSNFSGSTLTLGDNESVTQYTLHSGFGWGDRTSSLRVFCASTTLDVNASPYYGSNYKVGLSGEWNAISGAVEYRVTQFRQDACGSASVVNVQTGTTSGSGLHQNCGAPNSCYYRKITVEALDAQGAVITNDSDDFCEVGFP